jgi:hypothetical protein
MALSWTKSQATKVNRRNLAALMGLAGAGAIGAALAPESIRIEVPSAAGAAEVDHDTHNAAPSTARSAQELTADEMDAMHEAGVAASPPRRRASAASPWSTGWTARSRSST